VLLFNSSGQLFVSQRSLRKDCYPGCLDVTISGVVNYVSVCGAVLCYVCAGHGERDGHALRGDCETIA
jgi:isopentenyldiphosphate isomerase